jgi:hypothetical protein
MYPKRFSERYAWQKCNMKGSFVGSELITVHTVTACIAAFTLNQNLFARVCRKHFKVNTTKGIKTPSQIIIIEKESLCDEKDVHT